MESDLTIENLDQALRSFGAASAVAGWLIHARMLHSARA
jgi:hypothetical protein